MPLFSLGPARLDVPLRHSDALRRAASPERLRAAAILCGGAFGALARAGLAEGWPSHGIWPWPTFTANLAGTVVLAWLVTRLSERVAPTRLWRPLLGTGLCGALTTFSTFQIETIRLAKDGHPGVAVAYAASSIVIGMTLAVGGSMLARRGRYG